MGNSFNLKCPSTTGFLLRYVKADKLHFVQDDLSQDPVSGKWSCAKCGLQDADAVDHCIRPPVHFRQEGTKIHCYPRLSVPLAASLLGEHHAKYVDASSEARAAMFAPLLGVLYHITATIRNKSFTVINMEKVKSTRNVRARKS